jgi:hypothetical protein
MTVIAFHRWWTLRRTTTLKTLTSLQLSIIIGMVWLLSALFSIPHSIFNKTIIIPTIENLVRCHVDYPDIDLDIPLWLSVESNKILRLINKNLFLILLFLIKATTTQYFIPLSITIWLYIKIGYIVSKQGIIAGQSTDERKRTQSEARKRRIIMLVLVGKKALKLYFFLNLSFIY